MLVAGIGIGAGFVNCAIQMFWWTIDRVKPERFGADAFHVVRCALRDDDPVVGFDLMDRAVDRDFSLSSLDPEKLVTIIVNLFADLFAGLDRHQHELEVVAGVQHTAEVAVSFGQALNVAGKAFHDMILIQRYDFSLLLALSTRKQFSIVCRMAGKRGWQT